MKSLGLIEVKGLLAAIESVDVMLKSADVSILERTFVGGGLVSVSVVGDVGAVKAAVEAGVAAVNKLGEGILVSEHIIARPHDELSSIIGTKNLLEPVDELQDKEKFEMLENHSIEENLYIEDIKSVTKEKDDYILCTNLENLRKEDIDRLVNEEGIEKAMLVLKELKVVKLRSLARKYKDFLITGRMISKSDKKILLEKYKLYYEK